MNELLDLKQAIDRNTNVLAMPEWSEVFERQQALETPVWVEEWLNQGPDPISLKMEDGTVDTWLNIAMRQQPVEAPAWETEWIDWAQSRPLSPSLVKKNGAEYRAAITTRQPDQPSSSALRRGATGLRFIPNQRRPFRPQQTSKLLSA